MNWRKPLCPDLATSKLYFAPFFTSLPLFSLCQFCHHLSSAVKRGSPEQTHSNCPLTGFLISIIVIIWCGLSDISFIASGTIMHYFVICVLEPKFVYLSG